MGNIEQNWRSANNGQIQPPLTEAEISAFEKYQVDPSDMISLSTPETKTFQRDTALNALIKCGYIRNSRRPEMAPRELARHKE